MAWNKVLFETDATASVQFNTVSAASAQITSLTCVSATVSSLVAVSATVSSLSILSTVDFNENPLTNAVVETFGAVSDLPASPEPHRLCAVTSNGGLYMYTS